MFNHQRFGCRGKIGCATCFKFGHISKFCLTKARPRIAWRPKSVGVSCQPDSEAERSTQYSQPISKGEEAPRSTEETKPISVSSPIRHSATENPLSPSEPELHSPALSSPATGQDDGGMANFDDDPTPFVPEGINVEDWAWPARGRIIIATNPPRRHEEYAIVTVDPPPPLHLLYETIDQVVAFFEDVHRIIVRSCCPSPLGLCLIRFSTAIARQAMISLSLMHFVGNRNISMVEHDRGINLCNSPFTRTCWVMFLAFRLIFRLGKLSHRRLVSLVLWSHGLITQGSCLESCSAAVSHLSAEFLEV